MLKDNGPLEDFRDPSKGVSTFAQLVEGTADLLYKDVPVKYRWDDRLKHWVPYRRYVASLGRLVPVSPQDPERFYLRLLLCHRRSPKSFEDIRTVNGVIYDTFHDAALAAGYLENVINAVIILVYSLPDHASALWDRFKKDLSEDFLRSIQERDAQNNIDRDEEVSWRMAEYKCLMWLADYLISNGKTLSMYGLPDLETYSDVSDEVARQSADPMDIAALEVAAYEPDDLERNATLADQMNENQKGVFDQVIEAVNHPVGGQKLFFVDGPGGTGKSFLLEQILAHRKVAIAVASSGIAATLLTGGHTAHSTFRIPLKLSEFSTCSLSWQSQKAELIRKASLIIWDEAPMMHRACFEAVDWSFRDIMKNELEPFGGKVMVFSGDHRQILPVLKDATRAETLEACFKSSPLWSHLRQVCLTENMRVQTAPDPASAAELAKFSDFLLQIGEGRYPVNSEIGENDISLPRDIFIVPGARADARWNDEETKENEDMEAPPNFNLLPPTETPPDRNASMTQQDNAVYPGVGDDNLPDEYFVERAILAPTNTSVRRINDMVSERLSGDFVAR
ncbi:Helitron helicase-like protein [Phytophthora palmivora]|uniref:ATP-dependent DNA helicase n=1 Tax=Phytophthora palmivora TaxID=4796 RepID=A0A2P4YSZ0_9STRA|nr:Helitron helicase-like protein [Phytophthora palmivora]